ncbi:MAG: UDP-N-acetylmuramate dehydrogenase [bacterium]|nr:UDP-N-acetylmuramate dehydrogenase [bacterium]
MPPQKKVLLSSHTTMRVGGPAHFFSEIHDDKELPELLSFAREHKLPVFFLGEGSNILIGDKGFQGLVLKLATKGISFSDSSPNEVVVLAEAGENWDHLVEETVRRGLHGLENLSAIPGSVGAAPVQNIGAYGAEVKETVAFVEVFDTKTGEIRKLSNSECCFDYRDSIFKHDEGKHLVVLRVGFLLKKDAPLKTHYKDVAEYMKAHDIKNPTLEDMRAIVRDIRRKKLPDWGKVGTVGSFFKNPVISKEQYQSLLERFPEMPGIESPGDKIKIPLAWVIDTVCGFKGMRRGGIGIHERQALVVVNYDGGTAAEIRALADEIIASVFEKTGLRIEPEVSYIGEF